MKIQNLFKKHQKFLLIFLFVLAFNLIPAVIFAADANIKVKFENPLSNVKSIEALVKVILDVVVKIGAIVVVFMLIFTGFKFVTAQGNEQKISEAKTALVWTVVGALVLLGAQALSEVVCNTAKEFDSDLDCIFK